MFTPEFSYSPLNNFTIYVGGTVFWGTEESEFSGEYRRLTTDIASRLEKFFTTSGSGSTYSKYRCTEPKA